MVKLCSICGKKVDSQDVKIPGWDVDRIDGAVLGDYMPVQGHSVCIDNVDRLVVLPNRLRLAALKE